jgi:hypothetical protein
LLCLDDNPFRRARLQPVCRQIGLSCRSAALAAQQARGDQRPAAPRARATSCGKKSAKPHGRAQQRRC